MKKIIFSILILFVSLPVFACTSVIISGKKSASGRPVMYKHRDTDNLNNYIGWYQGDKYSFIGLVNSNITTGEVWTGTNSAGFSIMNTATYDLKDDDVPDSEMDKEGIVMFRALGICSTLKDFENLLDSLERPIGVEANFGVIDAYGGAAYYEVNNHSWVKFDVNMAPKGYLVVTNFTQTGRPEDRKGVDRYEKAYEIMSRLDDSEEKNLFCSHQFLLDNISRSGKPILRNITSSTIAIEGVKPGSNPLGTVMWTTCGYPATAVCVPLMVLDGDYIPSYLRADEKGHSLMCDNGLQLKKNGKDVRKVIRKTEKWIDRKFAKLYGKWIKGNISDNEFKARYKAYLDKILSKYSTNFEEYLR